MASRTQNLELRAFLLVSHGVVRAVGDGDLREYARRSPRGHRARRGIGRPGPVRERGDHHLRALLHGRPRRGPGDLQPRHRAGGRRPDRGRRHGGRLRRCLVSRAEGWLPDPPRAARRGGSRDPARQEDRGGAGQYRDGRLLPPVVHPARVLPRRAGAGLFHAEQAVEVAERTGSAFSRAWSWAFLGWAQLLRGEWRQAIEAIERSIAIAEERRTAAEGAPLRLVSLGECYLGLGDVERALPLVREGIAVAEAQGASFNLIYGHRALARALLARQGPRLRSRSKPRWPARSRSRT